VSKDVIPDPPGGAKNGATREGQRGENRQVSQIGQKLGSGNKQFIIKLQKQLEAIYLG
jgi:hypothetical protein